MDDEAEDGLKADAGSETERPTRAPEPRNTQRADTGGWANTAFKASPLNDSERLAGTLERSRISRA